jgi:hypothetical protein
MGCTSKAGTQPCRLGGEGGQAGRAGAKPGPPTPVVPAWPARRRRWPLGCTRPFAAGQGAPNAAFPSAPARYVFDPADVEAELEVSHTVRRAAAEALAEAQARLAAAETAQRTLREQLQVGHA